MHITTAADNKVNVRHAANIALGLLDSLTDEDVVGNYSTEEAGKVLAVVLGVIDHLKTLEITLKS